MTVRPDTFTNLKEAFQESKRSKRVAVVDVRVTGLSGLVCVSAQAVPLVNILCLRSCGTDLRNGDFTWKVSKEMKKKQTSTVHTVMPHLHLEEKQLDRFLTTNGSRKQGPIELSHE